MYLLSLAYQNARINGPGQFEARRTESSIAKWTVLDAHDGSLELLRLIVLSCSSPHLLDRISFPFMTLRGSAKGSLIAVNARALHDFPDGRQGPGLLVKGGVRITACGRIEKPLYHQHVKFYQKLLFLGTSARTIPGRDFILAYGDDFAVHRGHDAFDFSDPFFRIRRYHSLFSSSVFLTDPVALLTLLFHRGKYKRLAPLAILHRLCQLVRKHCGLNIDHWLQTPATAEEEWRAFPARLHRPFALLLDAVRHTLDAFPEVTKPLDLPGVVLLHDPSRWLPEDLLRSWLALMDELLPNMQFVLTLPTNKQRLLPEKLRQQWLPLPVARQPAVNRSAAHRKVDVLLIDVDSRMPNLALMKLARFFKQQGRRVTLSRGLERCGSAREIYASCIFSSAISAGKVRELQNFYSDSLQLGGSGVDIQKRLPEEIEALPPDYDLYPELADRAIGFLTRGCPLHCPFCIVPMKEGPPRQVSDLQSLLENGRRRKLILLDDNFLSLPNADELLDEMAARKIMVNFTQSLDLRFVDRERAALLRRVNCCNTRFTRSNYHFSLNDSRHLDLVREKYELFNFSGRDNVEFICMYGFDTTLAEDVVRFRCLRGLPGAYVFAQQYQPILGGPPANIAHFFDGDADRLIDELIAIVFTQNMKSMEKYYRWISRNYAETFGKLHMPLVDTIFRYNYRHRKGRYIQTMAGLKK
jgi:hypothetical protein